MLQGGPRGSRNQSLACDTGHCVLCQIVLHAPHVLGIRISAACLSVPFPDSYMHGANKGVTSRLLTVYIWETCMKIWHSGNNTMG